MGFLRHSPSEGPLSRSLTIHTHRTSYRPNARGALLVGCISQCLELCVATSKYLSNPAIDYRGQRYPFLSWPALCFYAGTQLPDNSHTCSCHLLCLRLFIIQRPDYTKFLCLRS